MSRIDQALRNWERAKGASPAGSTTVEPAQASALAHYPVETVTEIEPEPEPEPAPLPIAEPVVSKVVSRVRDKADIEARLVTGGSNSVSLEQYRRLAAVLHEEQVQGNLKTVMVTSAVPSEGKTLTIANLAYTLSESYGRRVLVIDADLRAPSLHRILGVRNTAGLGDALRDGRHELPFVQVSSRLSVLTAGRPGPAPLADLISGRMGDIIRQCSSLFDWVLVDTPPVGLLSDAQVLARFAGAVVFVIAAGTTPRAAVERAISVIGPDSIIGTVLNRVEERRIPEANYYDEYYGDGSVGE